MNRTPRPESDEIRDLLVDAGAPEPIPPADLAAIKNAARRELLARGGTPIFEGQSLTPIVEGRHSHRPWLAIAATLILALTAVWLFRDGSSSTASRVVATVELLRGENAGATGLEAGRELHTGARIDTGSAQTPAMVALRMASGHSVRLHADSRLRFESGTRLELERGAIYVDSGAEGAPTSLEIVTPLGTVRELGTQYEVRLSDADGGGMRVRVREGSITLSHGGKSFSAARGEQLSVDGSGAVGRSPIVDDDWGWAIAAAPTFDADGRTLEEYLAWFSRETGLEIDYTDPDLEDEAADIHLSGTAPGLTPEETLDLYLRGSRLDHRITDGALLVSRATGN